MLILDTNVVSALMRDPADAAVVSWLDRYPAERIWTTAVNVYEIRHGLARLPMGRRRDTLEAAFAAMLREEFNGRVASLDHACAEVAGRLAAQREAAGRPVDVRDTLIAGIALARRAAIATRNARHFADAQLDVLDPWAG